MHAIVSEGKAFRSATVYRRFDGSEVRVSTHVSACIWSGSLHVLGVATALGEPVHVDDSTRYSRWTPIRTGADSSSSVPGASG